MPTTGYRESFVLEEDVSDAVVPDLTPQFKPMLTKVRVLFKHIRHSGIILSL
jgi:hypothetical protein